MIYEVEGDILKTKAQAIAHGIAPNDDFKKGLAMGIREMWPQLYKDFRHYCHTQHPEPGTLWTWGGTEGHRVINLFTQEGAYEKGSRPGHASIHWVHHCLKQLAKEVKEQGFGSLAIPRIATGVGGLNWDEVKPLIEEELGALDIPVYLYSTYKAGQAVDESAL